MVKLTREMKVEQYGHGFSDGTVGRCGIPGTKWPKWYSKGFADGQNAWREAIHAIREELNCRLTSIAF